MTLLRKLQKYAAESPETLVGSFFICDYARYLLLTRKAITSEILYTELSRFPNYESAFRYELDCLNMYGFLPSVITDVMEIPDMNELITHHCLLQQYPSEEYILNLVYWLTVLNRNRTLTQEASNYLLAQAKDLDGVFLNLSSFGYWLHDDYDNYILNQEYKDYFQSVKSVLKEVLPIDLSMPQVFAIDKYLRDIVGYNSYLEDFKQFLSKVVSVLSMNSTASYQLACNAPKLYYKLMVTDFRETSLSYEEIAILANGGYKLSNTTMYTQLARLKELLDFQKHIEFSQRSAMHYINHFNNA